MTKPTTESIPFLGTMKAYQQLKTILAGLMPQGYQFSDTLVKNVEDVLFLSFQILNLETKKDRLLAVLGFLKYRSPRPLSNMIVARVSTILDEFNTEFNKHMDLKLAGLDLQDGGDGSPLRPHGVRILLDGWDRMDESPLANKIRALVSYCMAFSLLEYCGLPESFAEIIYAEFNIEKRRTKKVTGFVYAVLDIVEFVLSKAKICYDTGSLQPMFHTATTYTAWFDQVVKIKMWSRMLDSPELNGFTEHEYIHDLEEAIEKGENMQKLAKSLKDRREVGSLVSDLKILRSDHLTIKRASRMRKTPFALLLFGDTGIGKTYLTKMLFDIFGKYRGLPTDDEYTYVRNPSDEFMSGFKTQVIYVLLDDIGYMNPDVAQGGDSSLMEMIQMINTAPLTTNQAQLEKKGKVPFMPEFIIANTNTRTMNVDKYFSHPSAVQRRLPFIVEPTVKPEYRKEGSTMLDSSKVDPTEDGKYSDLWTFTVHEVVPQKVKRQNEERILLASEKPILVNASLKDFISWFTRVIDKHYLNQEKMLESTETMKSVTMCKHGLPSYMCNDLHLERGREMCAHCGFDCMWKDYHEACGGICEICLHCRSEEDIMEGDCTTCLTQLQLQNGIISVNYRNFFSEAMILFLCAIQMFLGLFSNGLRADHLGAARYNYNQLRLARNMMDSTRKTREFFHNMGERAEYLLGERPFAKTLTVAIAAIAIIKLMMKVKYKTEGGSQSIDELVPEPTQNEGINPWKNERYELTPMDTNRLSKSYKALPREQFVELVSRNVVAVRIRTDVGFIPNNMFCICDRYYIINTHSIPSEGEFKMDIILQEDREGVTSNLRSVAIGRSQVTILAGDCAVIYIPQMAPRKDLRDLLAFSTFQARCNGYYIYRNNSGIIENDRNVINVVKQNLNNVLIKGKVSAYAGTTKVPTVKGFCGSALILESYHGPVLAGFHYLGSNDGRVISFSVTHEMMEDFFKEKTIIDVGEITLNCSSSNYKLGEINKKSPILYAQQGNAQCYGSLVGHRSNMKSLVQDSLTCDYWMNTRKIERTHGQPDLRSYRPWSKAIGPMLGNEFPLSFSRVEEACDNYIDDVWNNLPPAERELMGFTDLETALNGRDGVQYMDKINFNTSAGFPHNKSKKFVIIPRVDEHGQPTGKVDLMPEIQAEVDRILELYDSGIRANPIFTGSLKDEPRAFAKIESGATRVFCAGPFAHTIVGRMILGKFIRVVQRNRLVFECAVGTNTHSVDWHKIYDFLLKHGETMFDGDYKEYDKSMMAMIIYSVLLVPMKLLMRVRTITQREKNHFHALATDLAYAWINFNGDLVTFLRNNPSGHIVTVLVNCMVNSVYFRIAYRELNPKKSSRDFQQHVSLITYGDDFVAGIDSESAPWFTFDSMKRQMEDIGVILTRADKQEGTFYYKSISDVDFLKRRFVWDDRLKRVVAPLAMESIEKSLIVGVRSKTISAELQAVSVMSSAYREMFFHGTEKFQEFREQIMRCIEEFELQSYVGSNDFPTHEELVDYYLVPDPFNFYGVKDPEYIFEGLELQVGIILSDVKPARIPGHVGVHEDGHTRQLVERYFIGRVEGIYQHPDSIKRVRFGHYIGEGVRRGQICMVEYISQNVYAESSYCSGHNPIFCDTFRERGLSVHFRMCEPQNFFLEVGSAEAQFEEWMWLGNHWPPVTLNATITNQLQYDCVSWEAPSGGGALSPSESAVDSVHSEQYFQEYSRGLSFGCEEIIEEMDETDLQDSEASDANFDLAGLELQSGEEIAGDEGSSGNQVNMQYVDETPGTFVDFNPIKDNTFYEGYSAETGLAKFLERPVLISSQTWDENDDVEYTVYPWYQYFNDTVIKRKIANYSLLSCNLHVKIMINASPFYYGLAYASYLPLPIFVNQRTIIDVAGSRNHQVPFSQRPHVCLYPQTSQGGEMRLPFMYPKNWLRVNAAQDFIDMGHLDVRSFTLLQNANSVSSGGATIQIYAWATDVCVAAPTLNLALQSGDEYEEHDGAISGPASAIARAGSELGKVPIIGPYAMATGFIASKIASVAKYFGFTNVPNLRDVDPFKNVPFHGFASTEISTPIEKLTLDAKNELSIDPRIVGLPPSDELSISKFVGHESWIYTANWEAGDNVDTVVFTSRVVPELIRSTAATYRYATPMAMLNRYFEYWRGDIIFRFRIICTKFHRGRLRITYDPDGDTVTNSVTSTTSFTKIVDISEESDFKIRIPYMQALGYLRTAVGEDSFTENMTTGNVPVVRNPLKDNGQISLRVFTKQTSPVASAPIQVVVTCWGADNLEFAAPGEGPQDYSDFEVQSGELQYDSPTEMIIEADRKDDKLNLVYQGERIVNLRQLLRRTNFYVSLPLNKPDANTKSIVYNTFRFPRLPLAYGYDPHGTNTVPKIVGAGSAPANIVKQSLLSNLLTCFIGHRGSMVYHMNVDSPVELSTIEVTRAVGVYTSALPDVQAVDLTQANSVRTSYARILKSSGFQGRTLTNQHTQTGISVHFPMYSNYRFLATRPDNVSAPTKVDDSYLDTFDVQVVTKPSITTNIESSVDLNVYYMIGTDFSLHFFLNVPTKVRYNLPVA